MTSGQAAAAATDTAGDGHRPVDLGYDAVLLAGFGGPEGPDDVMPFLRNVTRGRGIPDERLVEVSHHYRALGGVSPINEQNRRLRRALEQELQRRGVELPVLWGNRNWAPYLPDVLTDAAAAGHRRLLGLATSAYSSYSSCRQYREDFGMALASTGLVGRVGIDKIRPYYDQPGFLAPFVDGTAAALRDALSEGLTPADVEIVFTTHSIPDAMADVSGSATLGDHRPGGAYVTQHLAAAESVIGQVTAELADLGGTSLSWQLAYQSRSGPPSQPWLEPDINDVLTSVHGAGRRGVVVVPIGFVSDHVEVVWDLDHEAAETAEELGLFFRRVTTPGTDPRFLAALADLVQERLTGDPQPAGVRSTGLPLPARPDFCAPECCVNLRAVRPTTAAVDSAADWPRTEFPGCDVDPARLAASGIGT
ncbi:ferrochelatase [Nakamurella leprariae]|uniref:Coproporphyrin III ferrochelatase n=1 Tax=Nakamurella leprariae TaxID=2803911 RepID=A0A938YCK0_9ACTN|nr:ferrochelatase [Nakamurella leprariae]MBM9467344.1 ferrochelatase [Nakamurella leprariae]